jgi:hypothetical protein
MVDYTKYAEGIIDGKTNIDEMGSQDVVLK